MCTSEDGAGVLGSAGCQYVGPMSGEGWEFTLEDLVTAPEVVDDVGFFIVGGLL